MLAGNLHLHHALLHVQAPNLPLPACVNSCMATVAKLINGVVEKVYIVWPSPGGRLSSIPYRIGFCALLGFLLVFIMMIVGRIAYLTEDRQCIIGFQPVSTLTALVVDLFVNILLTSLFLWPLWRSKLLSPNIRRAASRTLL
jgi:hypothetical protein